MSQRLRNQRVNIYPNVSTFQYSLYMEGLLRIFGKENITYSAKGFPRFHSHTLPIRIGSDPGVKIYISAGDGPGINEAGLEWCDVYAKVNLVAEHVPEKYGEKVVPIGPHFYVRNWGWIESIFRAFHTYLICPQCILNPKDHFASYLRGVRYRPPESSFVPGEVQPDYVFYAAALWKMHPGTNRLRATFIEACLSVPEIKFEGGLQRLDSFWVPEYKHLTVPTRYPFNEWLSKVKRSAVGFIAPGDQGALTPKFGEYLACGKAVICTPLRTSLPAPLVHGEDIHYVDGSLEEMKAAVRLLTTDHEYRKKLERNARKYYETYLAPEAVVKRVIRIACERTGNKFEDL